MVKINSLVRLTAKENGETKCVIFVDSVSNARKSLEPFVSSIVASYPFIGAFGAQVHVHKLTDLASLPCVKSVAPHTLVMTCMQSAKAALSVAPAYGQIGYGETVSVAVIDTGVRPHLDFTLPENFATPYFSTNFSAFHAL